MNFLSLFRGGGASDDRNQKSQGEQNGAENTSAHVEPPTPSSVTQELLEGDFDSAIRHAYWLEIIEPHMVTGYAVEVASRKVVAGDDYHRRGDVEHIHTELDTARQRDPLVPSWDEVTAVADLLLRERETYQQRKKAG